MLDPDLHKRNRQAVWQVWAPLGTLVRGHPTCLPLAAVRSPAGGLPTPACLGWEEEQKTQATEPREVPKGEETQWLL